MGVNLKNRPWQSQQRSLQGTQITLTILNRITGRQDMRSRLMIVAACVLMVGLFSFASARSSRGAASPAQTETVADPVKILVDRLDLERYKATIKGLTQFGDRRQGTDRNRRAIDWIEAQLKSYGCANTERLKYDYQPPSQTRAPGGRIPREVRARRRRPRPSAVGGGRPEGTPRPHRRKQRSQRATGSRSCVSSIRSRRRPGRAKKSTARRSASRTPTRCTSSARHMDGHGWGEAANDDGSGTALVMELARVLSSPDVQTERSIRFILWNNEETGLNGSAAYVEQRKDLQGKENPPGSGRYPEPKWLGHDSARHDAVRSWHAAGGWHGEQGAAPRSGYQHRIPGEFENSRPSRRHWPGRSRQADEKYATDYPATVGSHMTNTDSTPFMNDVAAISVRENERGTQIGNGWDPQWHQPTDVYATYYDKDFRLGLNAAQTTLAATAQLAGATLKKARNKEEAR